uniref:Uncharacterized protein n=1 Tax=Oryza punctata TaxID=4537 RepID=A0A0E0KPR2_ORYPU
MESSSVNSSTIVDDQFTDDDSIEIGHEIFVLGAGDSWEVTEDPPTSAIVPTPPVCIGGCFY